MRGSEWLYFLLGILLVRCAWSADQETITAESGQDVNLTCRAPNNNFELAEWSRTDLSDTFVFVLENKTPNYDDQDPSFKNRVALQDKEMKDGDVSVILKNVTAADNGTYECRVRLDETHSWKLISIIYLHVDPPGQTGGHTEDGGKEDEGEKDRGKKDGAEKDGEEDGSVGLTVGLPIAVIVVAAVIVVGVVGVVGVCFLIRKLKQRNQGSYEPPVECQPVGNVSVFPSSSETPAVTEVTLVFNHVSETGAN